MTETKRTGRPPGTGAVAKLRAQLLEGGQLDALVKTVYARALAGDMAAVRILLDRVIPPLRAEALPVQVNVDQQATLTDQARAVVQAALDGQIPPDVAAELVRSISSLVTIAEGDELRDKLNQLLYGSLA